jgi:hypothetical protein
METGRFPRPDEGGYRAEGTNDMDVQSCDLECEVIDLSTYSIDGLRACDVGHFGVDLERVLRQVYRPRPNFAGGSAGAPGRAD